MIGDFATTIATVLIMSASDVSHIINTNKADIKILGEKQYSMENRYPVKSVNEVMKKNILLNLAYINGTVTKKSQIDWNRITSSFHFEKTLKPGEVFAFHDIVGKEYSGKVAFTSNSNFGVTDGYVTDGYLYGDGVCDLASLINWTAKSAGLVTDVPKDHRSVGPIPDVPDEYGVSIYSDPVSNIGANNNLYVTNNKDFDVKFHFSFDGTNLKVAITQEV